MTLPTRYHVKYMALVPQSSEVKYSSIGLSIILECRTFCFKISTVSKFYGLSFNRTPFIIIADIQYNTQEGSKR